MILRFTFYSLAFGTTAQLLAGCDDTVECVGGGIVKDDVCDCPASRPIREEMQCWASYEEFFAAYRDGGLGDAGQDGATSPHGERDAATRDARLNIDAAGNEWNMMDAAPVADASAAAQDATFASAADSAPSTASPAAPACTPTQETCDGRDEDCDGVADDGLKNACGAPCGQAVPPEDCATTADDDCDGQVNEGCMPPPPACVAKPETCDGMDEDCDGVPDNGVKNACGACGAVPAEDCDGRDNDCDGMIDEGVKNACGACGPVPAESCDGADNDCNGQTDDVANAPSWYQDCDKDGYAAGTEGSVRACAQPPEVAGCAWTAVVPAPSTKTNWDCNDTRAEYRPGADFGFAPEGLTSKDLDCDGVALSAPTIPNSRFPVCTSSVIDAANGTGVGSCFEAGGGCLAWRLADNRLTPRPPSECPEQTLLVMNVEDSLGNPKCTILGARQADSLRCR